MTITRSDVLRRATTIWPAQSVPYNQGAIHQPDGYRADCSGYVSMCWAIPLTAPGSWGGLNTVTLVTGGWMRAIDPNDLRPGDAVGLCGPGTAGDAGHIQLFTGWLNTDPDDSRYYCLEQSGGQKGPHRGLYDLAANGYTAYRFKDITDDAPTPAPPPAGDDMAFADDPKNVEALMWRVDAFAVGSPVVRGGPTKGEPVWLVQILTGLLAGGGSPEGAAIVAKMVELAEAELARDTALAAENHDLHQEIADLRDRLARAASAEADALKS